MTGRFWMGDAEPAHRTALPAPVSIAGYAQGALRLLTPEELHELVRAQGLLGEGEQVVAMISGGRDSVCLLDVAVALCAGPSTCAALHVNYGLRGRASDADERLLRGAVRALGVGLELVRVGADERAQGERGNLQAWARELRYEVARRLAAELDAPVATGHTASDQVETILYRLAASPGRRALLGMAPREGRLVRPLLGVTREQTAAYCEERGLEWRDDESNDSDQRYARARVRHLLVPALREVHPAAQDNVLRTAELLREETELLDGLVEAELAGRDEHRRWSAWESCRRRWRGWWSCAWRRTPPASYVPQAGARVAEILALAERGGSGGAARGRERERDGSQAESCAWSSWRRARPRTIPTARATAPAMAMATRMTMTMTATMTATATAVAATEARRTLLRVTVPAPTQANASAPPVRAVARAPRGRDRRGAGQHRGAAAARARAGRADLARLSRAFRLCCWWACSRARCSS